MTTSEKLRVCLRWNQQGHTTLDPTGQHKHDMQAAWEVCDFSQGPQSIANCRAYAEQQGWNSFEIWTERALTGF